MASNPDAAVRTPPGSAQVSWARPQTATYTTQIPQAPVDAQYAPRQSYPGNDRYPPDPIYPPNGSNQNAYQAWQQPRQSETKSITSLLMGLGGLLLSGLLIGGVMGVIGVIMGILGIRDKQDKIRCILGIIFGVLAAGVSGMVVWALFIRNPY